MPGSTAPSRAPDHHPRRARTRRRGLLATLSAAAVLAVTAWAPLAWATHYEASLEGSTFQIDDDANLRVDQSTGATLDWANVDQTQKPDAPTGRNDDSYSGGVKEDTVCPGQTTGSIPNNKSDLLSFGVYEEAGDPGFLHLNWVRVNEPSGTTLMDFEFNQSEENCATGPNKVRTTGDLLLEYRITQGGARADIYLRTWTGSAWDGGRQITQPDADGNIYATGTINRTAIPSGDSDGLGPMSPRTFGEASIDLRAIFQEGSCTTFGSAMLKSRASDSFTSQLKDYIAPMGISLTNCGAVKITKQTDPDGDETEFDFAKTFNTVPLTADIFALADGETESFTGVLFGEDYTVTESDLPQGWVFDSIDCSESKGVTYSINASTRTVTFTIDDEKDVLDCTFHNKALADLTIVKEVEDAPGGQSFDFSEDVTDGGGTFSLTPTGTGSAGAADTGDDFHGIDLGMYTVTETEPDGWNLVSATCDNGDDPRLGVTLDAGDDVTCTFVNARERGAIEITKTRKHAAPEGGEDGRVGVTFTVTSDELDETGEPVFSTTVETDLFGQACVDDLYYGDYTVTETVPAGYVAEDVEQGVTVSQEADCDPGPEGNRDAAATLDFVNVPLTDVTVSVTSQIVGGTASTIRCVDAEGEPMGENLDNEPGDVSVEILDLEPTAPTPTLICTIVVDP